MKAPLTFNSAKLTGHTIITVINLESMEETAHGKIKSLNLVCYRDINSQKVHVSKFRDVPSELTVFWHTVNSLKQKTPLGFFEHLSTDMCSIREGSKNSNIFMGLYWEYFFL